MRAGRYFRLLCQVRFYDCARHRNFRARLFPRFPRVSDSPRRLTPSLPTSTSRPSRNRSFPAAWWICLSHWCWGPATQRRRVAAWGDGTMPPQLAASAGERLGLIPRWSWITTLFRQQVSLAPSPRAARWCPRGPASKPPGFMLQGRGCSGRIPCLLAYGCQDCCCLPPGGSGANPLSGSASALPPGLSSAHDARGGLLEPQSGRWPEFRP